MVKIKEVTDLITIGVIGFLGYKAINLGHSLSNFKLFGGSGETQPKSLLIDKGNGFIDATATGLPVPTISHDKVSEVVKNLSPKPSIDSQGREVLQYGSAGIVINDPNQNFSNLLPVIRNNDKLTNLKVQPAIPGINFSAERPEVLQAYKDLSFQQKIKSVQQSAGIVEREAENVVQKFDREIGLIKFKTSGDLPSKHQDKFLEAVNTFKDKNIKELLDVGFSMQDIATIGKYK